MLKSGKEKEDILRYLLENYQTDEVTVEKDYYDFIRSLQQFYLVEAEGE